MEKNSISRKVFFSNSSKLVAGGIAGMAGINLLVNGQLKAETLKPATAQWPFPYAILDPDEARDKAHYLYWNGKDCASGVFGAFTELLSSAVGEPWTNIPMEIMLFGRGGGAGWGSLCGTLNGAGAIISMVTSKADSTALVNEVWGWYAQKDLPSKEANSFNYTDKRYTNPLKSNLSGSVLCHPSVSQWCLVANKEASSTERKERCARLAGDIAACTTKILNDHYHSTFVSTFHDSQDVSDCMSCHGKNTMTHMECVSCHTFAHNQATVIDDYSIGTSEYTLENAYPNPFNNQTTIEFAIPGNEKVRLEIYDLKGQLVNSLVDSDFMSNGKYQIQWNGENNRGEKVSNGIYFARLTTGNFMKSIKLNFAR